MSGKPDFIQNGAGVWLKISLAMLPVAAAIITMWADVRELKNLRASGISSERIATLEQQTKDHEREITYNRGQIELLWQRKQDK